MKLLFAFFALILSSHICFSQLTERYQASPSRCETTWTGSAAFSTYELTGTIPVKSGELSVKDGWIEACFIEFDVKGIQHDDKQLVNHLKSSDFFDVKAYPLAQFELTAPCEIKDGQAKATGMLSIKDHKKVEQFEVGIAFSGEQVTCTFSSTINRTEYGVNHNSPSLFDVLKDDAIADEFTLQSTLTFQLAE